MPHLLIDIGNSSAKVAQAAGGAIGESRRMAHGEMTDGICRLAKEAAPTRPP